MFVLMAQVTINNEQPAAASDASCINFGEEFLEADFDIDMSEEASEPTYTNMSMNDFLMGLQKHFALFILKLGEHHCLPTVVQTEVTDEVPAFINLFTSNYKNFVTFHLEQLGIPVTPDDDSRELFDNRVI